MGQCSLQIIRLLRRHWQWFLLSVMICLCLAQFYYNYVTPVYRLSAKMLIKQPDNPRHRSSNRMLRFVQDVGSVSNTEGIENEVEKLRTSTLMRDVVMKLKLYTDYKKKGKLKDTIVYATQPITVDLDPLHLDSLDKVFFDEFRSISMRIYRQSDTDSIIRVIGAVESDKEPVWKFNRKIKKLPAFIDTPFGTLTFTKNIQGKPLVAGKDIFVTITPPLDKALIYMNRLSVSTERPDSNDNSWIRTYILKMTSMATLTLSETNVRRGMDILRQLPISYNHLADADKNEIALRTEEFINNRIASLGKDLDMRERTITDIKQHGQLTALADVSRSVEMADKLSTELTDKLSQQMIIADLKQYVDAPENRYAIIPSNTGQKDGVSIKLIDQYNRIVQERNRLMKSASEESPHVKQLTSTADEMRAAISTALQQAQQTTGIAQKGIGSAYSRFQGHVIGVSETERKLAGEARQQAVMKRLYILLLQKREENSIKLSSTSNHGKLIDEPLLEGKIRPKFWIIHGIALGAGIVIPYAIFFILGFLRYKLEGHQELESLTTRPIIADVPFAIESRKEKAGIVARSGSNDRMADVFRQMRLNVCFMLKGEGNTILFTSSTSGEGKTFCAANLAVSFALLEKKVILCGMDIRKPALGVLFELNDLDKGLTPLLQMKDVITEDVKSQIQPSGVVDNLDLLLAGPVPPNPAEVLTRDSFRQVMTILKEEYDYVILDTAPVGLVTDTLNIGRYANTTIYICRAGYTPKYAIGQLNDVADQGKLPNACFVINDIKPHRGPFCPNWQKSVNIGFH